MSNLGIGVMINMLCGNKESVEVLQGALKKVIKSVKLKDNQLQLTFTDASGIALFDDGQSCCESRYMVCDENLKKFAGAKFMSVELKTAPPITTGDEYENEHEVQFLNVKTSIGVITCSNHVEHNGYYGGFSIKARAL